MPESIDKSIKRKLKEDVGAATMAVGNGDPAHVTNPSDNYSKQKSRYKKILRRKVKC